MPIAGLLFVHVVLRERGVWQGSLILLDLVNMNVDGLGRRPAVEVSLILGEHPTAADADVNKHIDAPAHNAISQEREVIHEGEDAHA
jgi:hypothetical protein